MPRDNGQGSLRLALVCLSMYILWTKRTFVCGVWMDIKLFLAEVQLFKLCHFGQLNQLLPQFSMIFFKTCIHSVDQRRCAGGVLMEIRLIVTELRPLNLVILGTFLQYGVWSLCIQLIPQFTVDLY